MPTMTCDELWRIYINIDWLLTAPVRDIGGHLSHLTWHLLLDHAGRARDVRVDAGSAPEWTIATDVAISQTLSAEDLADGMVSAPDLGLPPGRSAEEYYASVSRLPVRRHNAHEARTADEPRHIGCGSGCDGLPRSFELPPSLAIQEVTPDDARQVRRRVAIAYREHVTDRGTTPGDAWRWTKEILEPTIAWAPLLASAVRRAVAWSNGNSHYTYTRRSRRQSALPEVLLPGMRRPVPNVALVIDTSGSVDDGLLGRALGEVDGALRGLGVTGASVTVLACDAAVHAVNRVRTARDTRLAGGGGTDMRAGIATAISLRPRPDVIVIFTDGYTPWPDQPPPGAALIAAILGRQENPMPPSPAWATRIECYV